MTLNSFLSRDFVQETVILLLIRKRSVLCDAGTETKLMYNVDYF